jgi:competence protein ComEC
MLGALVAKVLYALLWFLKQSVIFFEKLPFAIIDGIAITTYDTLIIYVILSGVYCFWLYKKFWYLNLSLIMCLVLSSFQMIEKIEQQSQEKVIIYAINKHFAVDFISGKQTTFIADDGLLQDKDKMRFHLVPNWNALGIEKSNKYSLDHISIKQNKQLSNYGHYLFYKNKTILSTAIIVSDLKELIYQPEFIVLNKKSSKKFKEIFKLFPEAQYICDGTISVLYYQKMKQKNPNLKMRSVLNEGAITLKV